MPGWKYIIIKIQIHNLYETFSPCTCKREQKLWTGINSWEPLLYSTIGGKLKKKPIRSKMRTFYLFLDGFVSCNKYNFYLLCTLRDVICTAGTNK
jgi:hypothetical protein